jgi:superfamily II DNA or RNA helicase
MVIEIGNSYSKIKGLTPGEEKDLRNELSYTVGGASAYFSRFGAKRRSLVSKRGEFPTGLLHRVTAMFQNANIIDTRVIPKGLITDFKIDKAYEWQTLAVNKALNLHRGTISACTGTGKSLVIALLAGRLNVPTLVVVPNLEIKKQLLESLNRTLGARHKVTVENIDSRELWKNKSYDCLIIDEAHHTAAKTYRKLNKERWNGIYYRFFLTATPFRNDTEETLLFESIAGEVIYKLDYRTAIRKGYIVPIEAYYIDLPKVEVKGDTYAEIYKELIVNNKSRNELIHSFLSNLSQQGKSTLCLVKEVQHLHNIGWVDNTHGEDDESRINISRFNGREIMGLVATIGICGEGVDTKPCEYVIVAGLGKAKSVFMQQIGRAVRTYPGKESAKVIIFRDRSNKYTLRHFNAQKKILLEEYGVTVVRLEV